MAITDELIPNQANYQDAQNFDINIIDIYTDFISSIDKIRSYNNTNQITENAGIKSAINSLPSNPTLLDLKARLSLICNIESTPQESRCHAFFRIIGFPCCDSSKSKIFNPGYDIIKDASRTIDDIYKIGVIKDPLPGFRQLSVARETFSQDNAKTFSSQESIEAATLALSSGRNIRQFIAPLTDTQFDDTKIAHQQYSIDLNSSVGGIEKSLAKYQDVFGRNPSKVSTFGSSGFGHIIKPFLVDPVIDLMVNDSAKKIAVPFAPTKSELKVVNNTYVARPMLEQVIRDRFSIINPTTTSGTADASVLNYINSIPNINDIGIINNANNLYKLGDQTQFLKFLNIIRAMIKKLVEAQDVIKLTQGKYYWVPIPSKNGPEGGCTVQGVFVSTNLDSDLITKADEVVINALIKTAIVQADSLAANATATPDVGGYALPNALGLPNLGASTTPDSLGNDVVKNYNQVVSTRSEELKVAGTALQTVEIIMGEFSGLGLCDIVAILGGLYLMPKESLMGFLDDDALVRMQTAGLATSDAVASSPGLLVASNDFISVVKDLYNLMDKIHQDMSQNNGIS
jgi:hypothetical protein